MGYRHYLYLLDKESASDIRKKTKPEFIEWARQEGIAEEFEDEEPHISLFKIGKRFVELGVYDHAKEIQKIGEPFFQNKELQDRFSEYEPYLVRKEGLLKAIEIQKQQVIDYYEKILFPEKRKIYVDYYDMAEEEIYKRHIKSMYSEWKNNFGCFAIDLDENSPAVTQSWKFEYDIFEKIRLYKTTDWEKYDLFFMGW